MDAVDLLGELQPLLVDAADQLMAAHGGTIHLMWHRGYRYCRREAARVVRLVEEYAHPTIGAALGLQGEAMVLEGFTRNQFVLYGRSTQSFEGRMWFRSAHDLDFIFVRDERAYGVEVKNGLGYMAGGFRLILKYQLYPWGHRDLAGRVREELGLPVDSPRALSDGTTRRFIRWHDLRV